MPRSSGEPSTAENFAARPGFSSVALARARSASSSADRLIARPRSERPRHREPRLADGPRGRRRRIVARVLQAHDRLGPQADGDPDIELATEVPAAEVGAEAV